MNTKNIVSENLIEVLTKKPLIISGPCSAESEEQLIDIAVKLSKLNKVDILRAGIWKPRTKPGGFEGVGTIGLPWLQKAKKLSGLPTMIEVATAKHVEDALTFDVDVLWIGARTTVNPFSVQAIADSLKGVDIPVFIKNPVNPDLELWIGAIQRISKAGIKNIGLIHRGFSSFGNTHYRNAPMWNIPIELKVRFPELPLICDPSHICGRRDTLQDVLQQSINLDYDGVILETHNDPDNALSDAKQQITPEEFDKILENIIWRKEEVDTEEASNILEKLRREIDIVDDQILSMLSERMKVVEKIGNIKKQNNITILQPSRWHEVIEHSIKKGEKLGLSKDFIEKYFESMHMESIRKQNQILGK